MSDGKPQKGGVGRTQTASVGMVDQLQESPGLYSSRMRPSTPEREREREGGGGERGGRGGKNWPAVSRDHRPLPLRGFEELRALSEQLAVTDVAQRCSVLGSLVHDAETINNRLVSLYGKLLHQSNIRQGEPVRYHFKGRVRPKMKIQSLISTQPQTNEELQYANYF